MQSSSSSSSRNPTDPGKGQNPGGQPLRRRYQPLPKPVELVPGEIPPPKQDLPEPELDESLGFDDLPPLISRAEAGLSPTPGETGSGGAPAPAPAPKAKPVSFAAVMAEQEAESTGEEMEEAFTEVRTRTQKRREQKKRSTVVRREEKKKAERVQEALVRSQEDQSTPAVFSTRAGTPTPLKPVALMAADVESYDIGESKGMGLEAVKLLASGQHPGVKLTAARTKAQAEFAKRFPTPKLDPTLPIKKPTVQAINKAMQPQRKFVPPIPTLTLVTFRHPFTLAPNSQLQPLSRESVQDLLQNPGRGLGVIPRAIRAGKLTRKQVSFTSAGDTAVAKYVPTLFNVPPTAAFFKSYEKAGGAVLLAMEKFQGQELLDRTQALYDRLVLSAQTMRFGTNGIPQLIARIEKGRKVEAKALAALARNEAQKLTPLGFPQREDYFALLDRLFPVRPLRDGTEDGANLISGSPFLAPEGLGPYRLHDLKFDSIAVDDLNARMERPAAFSAQGKMFFYRAISETVPILDHTRPTGVLMFQGETGLEDFGYFDDHRNAYLREVRREFTKPSSRAELEDLESRWNDDFIHRAHKVVANCLFDINPSSMSGNLFGTRRGNLYVDPFLEEERMAEAVLSACRSIARAEKAFGKNGVLQSCAISNAMAKPEVFVADKARFVYSTQSHAFLPSAMITGFGYKRGPHYTVLYQRLCDEPLVTARGKRVFVLSMLSWTPVRGDMDRLIRLLRRHAQLWPKDPLFLVYSDNLWIFGPGGAWWASLDGSSMEACATRPAFRMEMSRLLRALAKNSDPAEDAPVSAPWENYLTRCLPSISIGAAGLIGSTQFPIPGQASGIQNTLANNQANMSAFAFRLAEIPTDKLLAALRETAPAKPVSDGWYSASVGYYPSGEILGGVIQDAMDTTGVTVKLERFVDKFLDAVLKGDGQIVPMDFLGYDVYTGVWQCGTEGEVALLLLPVLDPQKQANALVHDKFRSPQASLPIPAGADDEEKAKVELAQQTVYQILSAIKYRSMTVLGCWAEPVVSRTLAIRSIGLSEAAERTLTQHPDVLDYLRTFGAMGFHGEEVSEVAGFMDMEDLSDFVPSGSSVVDILGSLKRATSSIPTFGEVLRGVGPAWAYATAATTALDRLVDGRVTISVLANEMPLQTWLSDVRPSKEPVLKEVEDYLARKAELPDLFSSAEKRITLQPLPLAPPLRKGPARTTRDLVESLEARDIAAPEVIGRDPSLALQGIGAISRALLQRDVPKGYDFGTLDLSKLEDAVVDAFDSMFRIYLSATGEAVVPEEIKKEIKANVKAYKAFPRPDGGRFVVIFPANFAGRFVPHVDQAGHLSFKPLKHGEDIRQEISPLIRSLAATFFSGPILEKLSAQPWFKRLNRDEQEAATKTITRRLDVTQGMVDALLRIFRNGAAVAFKSKKSRGSFYSIGEAMKSLPSKAWSVRSAEEGQEARTRKARWKPGETRRNAGPGGAKASKSDKRASKKTKRSQLRSGRN